MTLAQLSFGAVVALLSSLYRHRLPDEARWEVLDSILARSLEVEAQRNRVTHSLWAKEDTGKTVRTKITAQKRRAFTTNAWRWGRMTSMPSPTRP